MPHTLIAYCNIRARSKTESSIQPHADSPLRLCSVSAVQHGNMWARALRRRAARCQLCFTNQLVKKQQYSQHIARMWTVPSCFSAERATVATRTGAGIRPLTTRLCADFRRVCPTHGAALSAAGSARLRIRECCYYVIPRVAGNQQACLQRCQPLFLSCVNDCPPHTLMAETKIIYHIDEEETPYLVKLSVSPEKVTLADFKNVLNNRPVNSYKFFFKSMDQDFG